MQIQYQLFLSVKCSDKIRSIIHLFYFLPMMYCPIFLSLFLQFCIILFSLNHYYQQNNKLTDVNRYHHLKITNMVICCEGRTLQSNLFMDQDSSLNIHLYNYPSLVFFLNFCWFFLCGTSVSTSQENRSGDWGDRDTTKDYI